MINIYNFNKYFFKNKTAKVEPINTLSLALNNKKIAIVIPVLAEKKWLSATLESLAKNPPQFINQTIILLCINDSLTTQELNFENQEILKSLREQKAEYLKILIPGIHLFWIDATHHGELLPSPGGVGHARKLGFDTLLYEFGPKINLTFISLDADTLVEENYLESIINHSISNLQEGGFTITFRHRCLSFEMIPLIKQYDQYLTEYVQGLTFAKSPYAYYTLGSAMGTTNENYLKVGGMKTHTGGEDFYFLQALRKLGPISEIKNTCVYPAARFSIRVPFGTGPRLQELINGKPLKKYPQILFQNLKLVIKIVSNCHNENWLTLHQTFDNELPQQASLFFNNMHFKEIWEKILLHKPQNDMARLQAFHEWFDAFKTLKFIHFLADNLPIYQTND